jgi:hypothetical protein
MAILRLLGVQDASAGFHGGQRIHNKHTIKMKITRKHNKTQQHNQNSHTETKQNKPNKTNTTQTQTSKQNTHKEALHNFESVWNGVVVRDAWFKTTWERPADTWW